LPTTRSSLGRLADSLIAARGAQGVSDNVKNCVSRSRKRTGLAIVAWAHGDGFDSTRGRKYVAPVGPASGDDSPRGLPTQNLSAASQLPRSIESDERDEAGTASDRGLILDRQKAGVKTLPAANMAGVTEPTGDTIARSFLTSWDECSAPLPPAYSPTRERRCTMKRSTCTT